MDSWKREHGFGQQKGMVERGNGGELEFRWRYINGVKKNLKKISQDGRLEQLRGEEIAENRSR